MMQLLKYEDIPRISINGRNKVLCGEMNFLEATVEHPLKADTFMIKWQRVRRNGPDWINTRTERYEGSTSRRLVIKKVLKEDEGEYQALISWETEGQSHDAKSNYILLNVLGERPTLRELNVTTETEGISIHYEYEVSQDSPQIQHIRWTKDGNDLNIDQRKYTGGGLDHSYLTITSPTLDDGGTYTCFVAKAVGDVSMSLKLDLPNVRISTENSICFGNEIRIDANITSCPPCVGAVWQKSSDSIEFKDVDVGDPKYYGSEPDPKNPVLVLRKATFDDKLYYRLLTLNKVDKSLSNTVFINVTGGPPNISICTETNIKNRSVSLICEVFLYENSPSLKEIVWMNNNEAIDISGSGGKYTGGTIRDATLRINDVNEHDAGSYQCKASNALGETLGDVIVLGIPEPQVQGPERSGNGALAFTAMTNSCPATFFVLWSKKLKDNDEYIPIDVNIEEYKGTSNSCPNPVLVIRNAPLHNHHFKIEAKNFIGTGMKKIPDNSFCPTDNTMDNKENRLAAIFKKKGSSIRFNKLRIHLIKNISEFELNSLKESLNVITSMELSTENVTTVEGFFTLILKEGILKERNVIMMQCLLESIGRSDLEHKCVEYAIHDKQAACYFKEPKLPEDSCEYVQLHVVDDIEHFTDIDSLVATVAATVGCGKSCIKVVGLHPESSFVIVLSMKECFAQTLGQKDPQDLTELLKYNIDWIKIDNKVIYITRGNEGKSEVAKIVTGKFIGETEDEEENEEDKESNQKTKGEKKQIWHRSHQKEDLNAKKDTDTQEHQEVQNDTCSQGELDDLHKSSDFEFWNACSYDYLQKELADILRAIHTLVVRHDFDCHIAQEWNSMENITEQLELRMQDLLKTECAIVVAGETSSGKSTIINLIIGKSIMAIDAMATTTRVCRIRYSDKMQVSTLDKEGKELVRTEFDDEEQLSKMLENLATTEDNQLEYIDVWFPLQMLKGNILIVDIPWKGDTRQDDVAAKMMEYLPNAVAFIFVVNVSSAGGFQDDWVLHIIRHARDSMNQMYCLDPEDVIFLFNKWDTVVRQRKKQEKDLYEELKDKVHEIWEGVKDRNILKFASALVPEQETFKEEFDKLQEILKEAITKNESRRVKDHLRFIKSFVDDCDLILTNKLRYTRQSTERTFQEQDQFWFDLQVMENKRQEAIFSLQESVDNFLEGTADALLRHLHSAEFKSRVLQDIEQYTRFTIGREIDRRIEKETLSWQEENVPKMFTKEILQKFTEDIILIHKSLHNIKVKMRGLKSPSDVEDKLGSVILSSFVQSGTAVAGNMAMMHMFVNLPTVTAAGILTGLVVSGLVALGVLDDYGTVVWKAYMARMVELTQPKIKETLRKTYEKRFRNIIESLLGELEKEEIHDLLNSVETRKKSTIKFYKEEEKVLLSLSAEISKIRNHVENLENVEIKLD